MYKWYRGRFHSSSEMDTKWTFFYSTNRIYFSPTATGIEDTKGI